MHYTKRWCPYWFACTLNMSSWRTLTWLRGRVTFTANDTCNLGGIENVPVYMKTGKMSAVSPLLESLIYEHLIQFCLMSLHSIRIRCQRIKLTWLSHRQNNLWEDYTELSHNTPMQSRIDVHVDVCLGRIEAVIDYYSLAHTHEHTCSHVNKCIQINIPTQFLRTTFQIGVIVVYRNGYWRWLWNQRYGFKLEPSSFHSFSLKLPCEKHGFYSSATSYVWKSIVDWIS